MAKVIFGPDGVTHIVNDGEALIEACDRFDDVSLSFGCTEGTCGVCELTIVSGRGNCSVPNLNEKDYLYPEDIDEGMRLGCQIKIKSGEVTIKWKPNRAK